MPNTLMSLTASGQTIEIKTVVLAFFICSNLCFFCQCYMNLVKIKFISFLEVKCRCKYFRKPF